MTPDTSQSTGAGPARIDVGRDVSLHEWAKKFDTTPDQVKAAVAAVGDLAADVEMHLKGSRSTTNAEQTAKGA